jgi:hypothetical protein
MSESRLMREYERSVERHSAAAAMEDSNQQLARVDRPGRGVCFTLRSNSHARGNEWSSADLRRLRELAAIGTPLEAIATALRRTTSAVRNKASMHGISLRSPR